MTQVPKVFELLPADHHRKQLLGVIGTVPVLPFYFEVEPHPSCLDMSLAEMTWLFSPAGPLCIAGVE